jgi:hypothetical protein
VSLDSISLTHFIINTILIVYRDSIRIILVFTKHYLGNAPPVNI